MPELLLIELGSCLFILLNKLRKCFVGYLFYSHTHSHKQRVLCVCIL